MSGGRFARNYSILKIQFDDFDLENTNQILSHNMCEIMIRLSSLCNEETTIKEISKMQPQSTYKENSCLSNKTFYRG